MADESVPGPRHGPGSDEDPAKVYGPVDRVAVLSDVHGNVPALAAVLAELAQSPPDLIVFVGDLTWGCEPEATIDMVLELGDRAIFVRGNAERAVLEMASGARPPSRSRETWMLAQHSGSAVEMLNTFAFSVVVLVRELGPVRFCHGSPRSDTELITPATPAERFAELAAGITEKVLATGHTHLQFDRLVAERRSINPGSVGLPYHEGRPGTAYWALLGPDVQLRQTRYGIEQALERGVRSGDPAADMINALLTRPPTPAEIIADAEMRVFAD
jgi:putative phosphoesterase